MLIQKSLEGDFGLAIQLEQSDPDNPIKYTVAGTKRYHAPVSISLLCKFLVLGLNILKEHRESLAKKRKEKNLAPMKIISHTNL